MVAVPTPLRRLFEYLPPKDMPFKPHIGARVAVPYGPRNLVGVIVSLSQTSTYPQHKLRASHEILDKTPLLTADIIALCQWAAEYYQHPIGEVFHTALPVELRKNKPAATPKRLVWKHTVEGKGLPKDALKRSAKQQQLHQLLLEQPELCTEQLKAHKIRTAIARAMQAKGLVTRAAATQTPAAQAPVMQAPGNLDAAPSGPIGTPSAAHSVLAQACRTPTTEQKNALEQLRYHQYTTYLLDGVTGSGKTEVYLQAIARVLSEGKQALVLVPEIGLTPQTLQRFRARFSVPVVELHSNVATKQRTSHWLRAASGEAKVIIGTRLAIFTSLPKLGIIIIDEEHDASFKQQEGLRYSARDLAVVRASSLAIPLVLGSATPSLESLQNAHRGRYTRLKLVRRAGEAATPKTLCLDMRTEEKTGVFARKTLNAIGATLKRQEQVLVFINRRGFAPSLLCQHCGWVAACQGCDARLTLHTKPQHMRCHHCNAQKSVPRSCPECGNPKLDPIGSGTARVEEFLSQQLPHSEVIRVDHDSMQAKNAMDKLTTRLNQGDPCILVGTQMLAKGHHFPKVTLAVLLDVDQALFSGDFRALEHLGQQVTQVSGRAGRASLPGTVILQSYQADHPLLQLLLRAGYGDYAQTLLENRRVHRLPPFWHMALLRAESKDSAQALDFLQGARQIFSRLRPDAPSHSLLGPLPSLLEKRQDRFRYQLQITCQQRQHLRSTLTALIEELESHPAARKLRWSIDIDPIDTT